MWHMVPPPYYMFGGIEMLHASAAWQKIGMWNFGYGGATDFRQQEHEYSESSLQCMALRNAQMSRISKSLLLLLLPLCVYSLGSGTKPLPPLPAPHPAAPLMCCSRRRRGQRGKQRQGGSSTWEILVDLVDIDALSQNCYKRNPN